MGLPAAVTRAPKVAWAGGTFRTRISYILHRLQLVGPVGEFTLTIDKAPPKTSSASAANVKKTGPTTFEIRAKDIVPTGPRCTDPQAQITARLVVRPRHAVT